jgi:hypothetical protein
VLGVCATGGVAGFCEVAVFCGPLFGEVVPGFSGCVELRWRLGGVG